MNPDYLQIGEIDEELRQAKPLNQVAPMSTKCWQTVLRTLVCYDIFGFTRMMTFVPPPGLLLISRSPLRRTDRSRIPWRPK